MPTESTRARATEDTRQRILDVARELLGRRPDAGMADIAAAAGVVRRTVYGHFPTRTELVATLGRRAVTEIATALREADGRDTPADEVWADFVRRLWPVVHRYRVLVALRRGPDGEQIHALLQPVDRTLAGLVRRGQRDAVFGRHLPAPALSQVAFAAVFNVADHAMSGQSVGADSAALTSLLTLGVTEARARQVLRREPAAG